MKRIFFCLTVAVLIVPVMFVMAACGNGGGTTLTPMSMDEFLDELRASDNWRLGFVPTNPHDNVAIRNAERNGYVVRTQSGISDAAGVGTIVSYSDGVIRTFNSEVGTIAWTVADEVDGTSDDFEKIVAGKLTNLISSKMFNRDNFTRSHNVYTLDGEVELYDGQVLVSGSVTMSSVTRVIATFNDSDKATKFMDFFIGGSTVVVPD